MYTIYADGKLLHSPHLFEQGCGVFSPKVTVELNKAGSLEFTMPPRHVLYNSINKLKSIITVFQNGEEIFRGRVLDDTSDFFRQKKIHCEGQLAYLLDSKQRPYGFTGTVADLFKQYITNHNARVDADKRFTVGKVTVSGNITCDNNDYPNTFDEIQKQIVDTVGGHVIPRLENGVRYLDLIADSADQGSVNSTSQTIEFGINLLDISEHISAENIFTVLIPLGATVKDEEGNTTDEKLTIASVNDGKDYLENETAIALFGRIEEKEDWNEIEDANELKTQGEQFLGKNIELAVSLTLKAVDLHLMDVNIEAIELGDWVRVISIPHGLNAAFQCRKIVYDLENPDKNEYSFGVDFSTLTDQQVAAKKNAQGVVTMSATGYVKSTVFSSYQTSVDTNLDSLRTDVDYILALVNSELPLGYTKLEYIESSGTQYIDINFAPNNNTRVVMDVQITDPGTTKTLFGARTTATSNNYAMLWSSDNGLRSDYNNSYEQIWLVEKTTRRTIDKNKETTIIDGTSKSYTNTAFQAPCNMTLFALNNNGNVQWHIIAKLYSCKVYDNGTLIRDFIPCINANGGYGLYDKVNAQFYGNAGTGAFTGA